ncbi:c-type cytochrome [Microvirga guangxiensis]|uniref:Cytochrome c2 n=1 Tax=Microvirga guangxiensis TaxID=549386 RepID=A0A1G5F1J1_9HYPH|nr:cytochrome c [Microvirga guangxiensis]SCY32518.1 Cytochrome c2 [Microvirga guangxiensis]
MIRRALNRLLIASALIGLVACSDQQEQASILHIAGGEPEQGRALIHSYGCGTCHQIDGIRGARGRVGPILENYAQQHLLAGFLPNTPRNLMAWLMDPVALKPQTGMPSQGVTEAEARHMAAYLYSLGSEDLRVYPSGPPLPLRDASGRTIEIPDSTTTPSETDPRTRRIIPDQNISQEPRT